MAAILTPFAMVPVPLTLPGASPLSAAGRRRVNTGAPLTTARPRAVQVACHQFGPDRCDQ
jgi:hypothetical protein